MKYIRTKAGEIYDIDDLYICDELNDKPYGVKNSNWVIYKESIIKQADTIEELCDEFILSGNRPIVISQTKVKSGRTSNKTPVIYGAIWTDKGLIYVARMNEKGELELI